MRRPLTRHGPPAAVACAVCLALAACYSYSPVEGGLPDAGSEIRLRITPEAGDRIVRESFLFRERPEELEGELLERTASRVRIGVSRPARREFVAGGRSRDTLSLDPAQIRGVELKSMETGKTAALAGGVTAGLVVTGAILLQGGGTGGDVPNGGGGQPLGITVPISLP